MKIIFDYNRTIFNPDSNALYSGVLELLKNLSKEHDLFLVSMNEFNRKEKLSELEISNYFKKILFVEKKTVEIFKEIAEEEKNVLIVGDRVRSEIYLGNILGFITVWVKQGKFSNELPQNKSETPMHSIDEIKQLLEIIKIYE